MSSLRKYAVLGVVLVVSAVAIPFAVFKLPNNPAIPIALFVLLAIAFLATPSSKTKDRSD